MKILLILLLSLTFSSSLRLVTEINALKLVNGQAGVEFLAKTSINLQDDIVLKMGVSETFSAPRSNIYALNHNLIRIDFGVYWILAGDLMLGYTHSERNLIEGATNLDVFPNKSVDILSLRKEFDLEF